MNSLKTQSKPLMARLFSLEGLLAAFGLFSLNSGLWRGELLSIFWGTMILTGLVILIAVRRRDWQQHWRELGNQRGGRDGDTDQR